MKMFLQCERGWWQHSQPRFVGIVRERNREYPSREITIPDDAGETVYVVIVRYQTKTSWTEWFVVGVCADIQKARDCQTILPHCPQHPAFPWTGHTILSIDVQKFTVPTDDTKA